jgi:hypothetical protein
MQNYYLQEKLAEVHRQELLREAAQRRMVAQVRQQPFSLTRRSLGKLGQCFVMLGTRLQQLEPNNERAVQQL